MSRCPSHGPASNIVCGEDLFLTAYFPFGRVKFQQFSALEVTFSLCSLSGVREGCRMRM